VSDNGDTAIKQEQDDIGSAESSGMTGREPILKFDEMLDGIRVSLRDLTSSDTEVDWEDNEDTERSNLRKHDEPDWVMHIISKMVD
jgi:hypothetical protein